MITPQYNDNTMLREPMETNNQIRQQIEIFFQNYHHLFFWKKELILRSDDIFPYVFYVKNGFLRTYRISEDGEELTLTILQPDDFFPMTYGLNNMPKIYYLEAMTPLELYKAPRNQFVDYLKRNHEIFFQLSARIMDRYDGLLARMEYIVWSKAYTKVAATLLLCARRFGEYSGNEVTIQVPLTHKDIATLIGITRETTSIEMKHLEKKGLLTKRGKLLVVRDILQLEKESLLNNQDELLQNQFI